MQENKIRTVNVVGLGALGMLFGGIIAGNMDRIEGRWCQRTGRGAERGLRRSLKIGKQSLRTGNQTGQTVLHSREKYDTGSTLYKCSGISGKYRSE